MRGRWGLTRPCRVIVVDDDDINRRGMIAVLDGSPDVRVTAGFTHAEALAAHDAWVDVDVVIVDAADHRQLGDQFPGVAVVSHIRRSRPYDSALIIVVTGHFFDDAVRRRMREARADLFYHRGDLADADVLREIVLRPEYARKPVPPPSDPETLIRLGVTDSTRVNHAVGHAVGMHLEQELHERSEPRSRRWLRLRREFNSLARLTPMTGDGRVPDRPQDLPSLPQIGRFLDWATKIKSR